MLRAALLSIAMATPAYAAEMSGQEAMQIYQACLQQATNQCRRNTRYCQNYRQSYVKVCMLQNNVPTETIMLLLYG